MPDKVVHGDLVQHRALLAVADGDRLNGGCREGVDRHPPALEGDVRTALSHIEGISDAHDAGLQGGGPARVAM
ncbi:MAG: hypothetical protein OXG37_08930 [Actinomycetia bacterium]|nr:hypothetical protein [Actinomycetes bacterium]